MSDKVVSLPGRNKIESEQSGKFKTGDPVCLVSGGPIMTVRKATKTTVLADWFIETHELQTADFLPAQLRLAEFEIILDSDDDEEEGTAH